MGPKEKLYEGCKKLVNERVEELKVVLADLRESAANETKSTAGDKHETALAMLQIEQANTSRQLEATQLLQQQLNAIDISILSSKIILGSLVKTSQGQLFVSIALGKITIDNATYIILSPRSPLGIKLLGLQVGEQTEMNGKVYKIESIS